MRSLGIALVTVSVLVACTTQRTSTTSLENVGTTSEALFAQGQACSSDVQCTTGHCVDAVCCNTACGGGARDNQACSNIYGTVAGLTPGQCFTLPNGSPCGNLEPGTTCRFRTSLVTSNTCPAAVAGMQEQACYPCADSTTCPAGRPVCNASNAATKKPLDTYFMLDHSSSMGADCAIPSAGTSKWCYATNSLAKYFQSAGATGNRAALQYFSLPNADCATGTPYDTPAVALTTLPVPANGALVTSLDGQNTNNNLGTQIEGAARGIATFTKNNVTAGRIMSGVLITDGAPNGCNGNASQLAQILRDHFNATGIRIFVIGMTGANWATLETLANGGGAPAHSNFCNAGTASCHYYSVGDGDPAAFAAALDAIQAAAGAGCEGCGSNNGSGGSNACPTSAAPICNNGQCVGCVTNPDCFAQSPSTPRCDTSTNTCTTCTQNTDCPSSAPICNAGACVPCTAGNIGACAGSTPVCDPQTNTCVGCTTGSQCPSTLCDPVTHQCTSPCTQNSDCAAPKPICNNGVCVQCTATSQCPGDAPVCDPVQHVCTTSCTLSSQCPGDAPVCDPVAKTCVGCVTDADCKPGEKCDGATHTCIAGPDAGADGGGTDPGTGTGTGDDGGGSSSSGSGGINPVKDPFSIEGGGCACQVTGASRSAPTGGLLAALGLGLALVSRRKRR